MSKLCKREDMHWKEWRANNIDSNPIEELYCILDCDTYARKYSIVPQYPSTDGVCVYRDQEPEYYILFEASGHKATEEEQQAIFYQQMNYSGYLFKTPSFIRVFKTLDDAKKRAYHQYTAVYGYVASHFDVDIDKSHFFVQ